MSMDDLYSPDPNLSNIMEKWAKRREQTEGLATGMYLSSVYAFSAATAEISDKIFDQPENPTLFATVSTLAGYSIFKSIQSAHIARDMNMAEFTKGAIAIPLFATWLNFALPDHQPVEQTPDNVNASTLRVNTIDIELE